MSQDLSLCADGTAGQGQSPLRCWGSEPPVLSTARLRRPAAPPEAAGKRRDSLTVHVSVFRKRGEKGRRNKSTVERQLVNAESSRSEGLTERCAGSPPVPEGTSLPWSVFPTAEEARIWARGTSAPRVSQEHPARAGAAVETASRPPAPSPAHPSSPRYARLAQHQLQQLSASACPGSCSQTKSLEKSRISPTQRWVLPYLTPRT